MSKSREASGYIVQLSANLSSSSSSPMEAVFAEVELCGAITFYRFVSGELVVFFDLSSAEVDALIAANRRRRRLMKRVLVSGSFSVDGCPF